MKRVASRTGMKKSRTHAYDLIRGKSKPFRQWTPRKARRAINFHPLTAGEYIHVMCAMLVEKSHAEVAMEVARLLVVIAQEQAKNERHVEFQKLFYADHATVVVIKMVMVNATLAMAQGESNKLDPKNTSCHVCHAAARVL